MGSKGVETLERKGALALRGPEPRPSSFGSSRAGLGLQRPSGLQTFPEAELS